MLHKNSYYGLDNYDLDISPMYIDELDFAPSVKYGFWTTYYVDIMVDSKKMRKYTFKKVTLTTICA